MEFVLPFAFSDFPEDVQIRILSFLDPSELESFARTSTTSLALCRDDERLWFLKCGRRWGSQTQIKNWGGRKISYRHLYHLLEKYENLIGFWFLDYYSTISPSLSTFLVCFEWGSFYITGYRVSPSKSGGYGVTKKPFLWITATSNGKGLNYLDTDGRVSLTDKDLLREDSEKLRGELILVDIQFALNCHLLMWENPQFFEFRRRLSTRVEYESVYGCPPDRLMAQICGILGGKHSLTRDTTSKKERRQRVQTWDSQHFRKAIDSPTPSRPLQGLWKGVSPNGSLNLYWVSYREVIDYILCENVGGSSKIESYEAFRALSTVFMESPYPPEEESRYSSRVHVRPPRAIHSDDHDLWGIFYADSSCNSNPSYLSGNMDDADGRIWVYTNGTFGFGFLRDDFIVDLKPVVKNGCLLDLTM
ncbi:F-box protein At3g12350-like [Henckelia pumila]|uniref:F-box protein At3g12350-like n=1 Tax=Henckelia pumila TaxID=405737 RepID=UPI003C6DD872